MSQYSLKVNKELEQRFCITDLLLCDLLLCDKFLQKKKLCHLRQTKDAYHFTVCMSQVAGEQSSLNWWLFPWFSIEFYWRSWPGLQAVEDFTGAGESAGILQDSWSCWSFSNMKLIPSKEAIRKASTRLQCFSLPCLRSSLFLQCLVTSQTSPMEKADRAWVPGTGKSGAV